MNLVYLPIKNPARVARHFGECGDYSPDECRFWVGTPKDLVPSRTIPLAARRAHNVRVATCGGSAWLVPADPRHEVRRDGRRRAEQARAWLIGVVRPLGWSVDAAARRRAARG